MSTCQATGCTADALIAVRTTEAREAGLKTLVFWDATHAQAVAERLCGQHGYALLADLARAFCVPPTTVRPTLTQVLSDPGKYAERRFDLGPEADETEPLHVWQARALQAAGLVP